MNTKDPYIPYGTCPRIETPWQTVSSFLQFKTSFKAFGIQEDTRNLSPFKKIHGLAQIYLKHKKRQEVFFSPRLFFLEVVIVYLQGGPWWPINSSGSFFQGECWEITLSSSTPSGSHFFQPAMLVYQSFFIPAGLILFMFFLLSCV